jgi:hypothetical protein
MKSSRSADRQAQAKLTEGADQRRMRLSGRTGSFSPCPLRARTSETPGSTTVNHGEVNAFDQVTTTCANVWSPVGAPKAGVARSNHLASRLPLPLRVFGTFQRASPVCTLYQRLTPTATHGGAIAHIEATSSIGRIGQRAGRRTRRRSRRPRALRA